MATLRFPTSLPGHKGALLSAVPRLIATGLFVALVGAACTVVTSREIAEEYADAVEPLFGRWDKVVNQWDAAANDPTKLAYLGEYARNSAAQMQLVIASWDRVKAPDKLRQYHALVREAMTYEQKAFETMAQYYSGPMSQDEFSRLRRQAMELWTKKDEALAEAVKVAPP